AGLARAGQLGREEKDRIVVELRSQTLIGQFSAVTLDPWKTDFEGIAFRAHCVNGDGLARRLRWRDDRLRVEVERNPQDVGVLNVEEPLVVQIVRLPPKRTTNHLLAQELGA